jgi:nucleoside-diphosphate-sugar epimerase
MTTQVNGASKRAVSPQRVLVTGGSGFTGRCVYHELLGADVTVAGMWPDIPVRRTAPKPGEMAAVIAGIVAARTLGRAPADDPKNGLSTVWPEFSEAESDDDRHR